MPVCWILLDMGRLGLCNESKYFYKWLDELFTFNMLSQHLHFTIGEELKGAKRNTVSSHLEQKLKCVTFPKVDLVNS